MLLAALILAGCGGAAAGKEQTVSGTGFRFAAPAGWNVVRRQQQVTAGKGSQLVRVSAFPLVKAYSPALYDAVERELKVRIASVAADEGGRIDGTGTATAAGIKSHVWRIAAGANLDEYTFVLTGKREFELLCRRPASGGDQACRRLVQSFTLMSSG